MMLTGSVTEAAKLMAVTQPAVSRLLRDFQALLKMELFERRGTGLVPTAAASCVGQPAYPSWAVGHASCVTGYGSGSGARPRSRFSADV